MPQNESHAGTLSAQQMEANNLFSHDDEMVMSRNESKQCTRRDSSGNTMATQNKRRCDEEEMDLIGYWLDILEGTSFYETVLKIKIKHGKVRWDGFFYFLFSKVQFWK
jgi:hypothetical protein